MHVRIGFFLVAIATAALSPPVGARQPGDAAAPQGFASLDGGTTGGDPGNTCVVSRSDERALRKAIACARDGRNGGIVTFAEPEMRIQLDRVIHLPSNTTVQGPVILDSDAAGHFRISGESNIIIRDITFRVPEGGVSKKGRACPDPTSAETVAVGDEENPGTTGCTTPITIQGTRLRKGSLTAEVRDSRNIWIDHNSFSRCGDKCIVVKNGAKDAQGRWSGGDNITISNNVFEDSFFAILVTVIDAEEGGARHALGHSTDQCERVLGTGVLPRMRVTIHGNLFDRVRRRSARAAYCTSYVHQYNNVIRDFALPLSLFPPGSTCETSGAYGFGPSARFGAQLLLEANYIAAWPDDPKGCKAAIHRGDGAEDSEGYVREDGNLYANGAHGGESRPDLVPDPPYDYDLRPASEVLEQVLKNAGPAR